MQDNDFGHFPGAWGELAELLREVHETLGRAGEAGVSTADLAVVSRRARAAVKAAEADVDLAVEQVGLVVLDARGLAVDGSWRGPSGGRRSVATQREPAR